MMEKRVSIYPPFACFFLHFLVTRYCKDCITKMAKQQRRDYDDNGFGSGGGSIGESCAC